MKYAFKSLFDTLTDHAVEAGLLDNKNEIAELQKNQEDLISAIIHDVSKTIKSDSNEKDPFYLSFRYVFSKGFELAILSNEFGSELYFEYKIYDYDDLMEDRFGLAVNQKWISLIEITLSLYIDGLYDSYKRYFAEVYGGSENIDTWDMLQQALRIINVLGITFGKRCVLKKKAMANNFMEKTETNYEMN